MSDDTKYFISLLLISTYAFKRKVKKCSCNKVFQKTFKIDYDKFLVEKCKFLLRFELRKTMQAKKLLAPETQSYVKIKLNLWIKLSFYLNKKLIGFAGIFYFLIWHLDSRCCR